MPVKLNQPLEPGHPFYGNRIFFKMMRPEESEKSSTQEKEASQQSTSASEKPSKEEAERLFQESLPDHLEEIRESALHQWKGSPSEKTEK